MSADFDRPRKSWREIDNNKDRSAHRKDDRPKMSPFKQQKSDAASKAYKSRLDSFFNGEGEIPSHLKDKFKALNSSEGGKKRKEAFLKIKNARRSKEKTAAVAEYLKNWELSPDYDLLMEVLACSSDKYIKMTLNLIEQMFDENRVPKHKALLEQKFRTIISLEEDPGAVKQAGELIKKLRLFK
jgi:hypothetical protein